MRIVVPDPTFIGEAMAVTALRIAAPVVARNRWRLARSRHIAETAQSRRVTGDVRVGGGPFRIHQVSEHAEGLALCLSAVEEEWVDDAGEVTCRACLKIRRRAAALIATQDVALTA